MEQDPLTLLIGGICGASVLMLAWAIVQVGEAIAGLTGLLAGGITVTLIDRAKDQDARKE